MKYFAGLDVSLEWTSVCVVDDEGEIVREARVLSEPDALVMFFSELGVDVTRIALEAGPLSQWLHDGLAGRPGRGGPAGGVRRDAAIAGGAVGNGEQE